MTDRILDERLVGSSEIIRAIRFQLQTLARFPWPVRLEGERGTGKNLAAKYLHQHSRRNGKFVRCGLNVVSASEGREVAVLCGWARGAFTGAYQSQPGAIEQANGGTLFLNEVGTTSAQVQEVLLHLLEEETVQRIGETQERRVDARIVFGTNVDLGKAIDAGEFRADLFDRMGIHVVRMPPLVERLEDIPELAQAILARKARRAQVEPPVLRPADLDRLRSHSWPGNVRELVNHLEYFVTWGRLSADLERPPTAGYGSSWRTEVRSMLVRHRGNKRAAARALGISHQTLYEHLKATGS